MLQSPQHMVAMTKGGVGVPAYAYAYNNPLHSTDETGLFALKGKRTNWDEAIQEAKERAGCGSNDQKSCACSQKLQECGSGRCNICTILDSSEPAHIVQNLKCANEDALGCSNRNNKGYFSVQFDQALCSPPAPASELASIILHEAAHHCQDQTGKHVGDSGKCSAQAISEACK